jgi:L-cysteine desulfidase
MSVGIPGLKEVGLSAAAVIGAVGGDYTLGLQVLNNITETDVDRYYKVRERNIVSISVSETSENLYIESNITTESGYGRCIIRGSHSNIIFLEIDGEIKIDKKHQNTTERPIKLSLMGITVSDIVNAVNKIEYSKLEFLLEGAEMNKRVAEYGLQEKPGMAVGASIYNCIIKGIMSDDMYHRAQAYTAAASDTRMSGYFMPVMSSAGSGNHGLTAILPVVTTAERIGSSNEEIVRALAISHLVTIYIKNYTGTLSALCGCGVAAATGASAAIAYLLGANIEQIEGAVNNMVADVSGMICDGAKAGCALKLSTAAGAAVKSALLSIGGSVVPCNYGIIGNTCEDTIRNLGKISFPGMKDTDKTILEVMEEKNASNAAGYMERAN